MQGKRKKYNSYPLTCILGNKCTKLPTPQRKKNSGADLNVLVLAIKILVHVQLYAIMTRVGVIITKWQVYCTTGFQHRITPLYASVSLRRASTLSPPRYLQDCICLGSYRQQSCMHRACTAAHRVPTTPRYYMFRRMVLPLRHNTTGINFP